MSSRDSGGWERWLLWGKGWLLWGGERSGCCGGRAGCCGGGAERAGCWRDWEDWLLWGPGKLWVLVASDSHSPWIGKLNTSYWIYSNTSFPSPPERSSLEMACLGKHVIGEGSLQLGCRELHTMSVFSNARESGGWFQHGEDVHSLAENSDPFT